MRAKIISGWWRLVRLRLATLVAPADVDVRDTLNTLCRCQEPLLEAVFFGWLEHSDDRVLAPVTYQLDEMYIYGAVEADGPNYQLTRYAEKQLARMWGPDIAPPWSAGWSSCPTHGLYETLPGDPITCPDCVRAGHQTITGNTRSWWSRLALWRRLIRNPL